MSTSTRLGPLARALPGIALLAALAGCAAAAPESAPAAAPRPASEPTPRSEPSETDNESELVYDRSWGGYTLQGRSHVYFYRTHYFGWNGRRWYKGLSPHGPWERVNTGHVPQSLLEHHASRVSAEQLRRAQQDGTQESAPASPSE